MTWNYRVVSRVGDTEDEVDHGIHEVYYNAKLKEETITYYPVEPYGESREELKADLEHMLKAFDKPTLRWEDF